jgi:hypothetical protein
LEDALLGFPATNYEGYQKSQTLTEGQSTNDLQVALIRGGRIVGQMLDEDGRPPKQGLLTLLRQGERNGRSGFINVSGDHQAAEDGRFQSPRFPAGHTFSVLLASCESPQTRRRLQKGMA